MRIGIIGSRKRLDKEKIEAEVNNLPPDSVVVSGGCRGVDSWAVSAAKVRGLKTIEFLPDLTGCSKRYEFTKAFYARNVKIAENSDLIIAFVSPDRRGGTEHTIKIAQKLGKPVRIL